MSGAPLPIASGRWSGAERSRLALVVAAIAALHVTGWALYLWQAHDLAGTGGFAGAGVLAYVLGMRHAFDADHIAAIDDTTRLMMSRGRRPVGVGFFFALGHSAVVLVLALVTAVASARLSAGGLATARAVGGDVSVLVAVAFLLVVAGLNIVVLTGLLRLWQRHRARQLRGEDLDLLLLDRGLMNRLLGARTRGLIRSSWHMAPVGFLFGLGLETASEVTLLALSASTASGGRLPVLAVLSLPLLFAAGMSVLDTADSLVMTRAYSWAQRHPGRRLYYNLATTAITVLVGLFVASVYLAGAASPHLDLGWLRGYGGLADHFELLGYVIAATFALSWAAAVLLWRTRYRHLESVPKESP